jgi:hypothetical protein
MTSIRLPHAPTTADAPNFVPLLFIAAVIAAAALHAIAFGPAMRERVDRHQAEQTNLENQTLCDELGLAGTSERQVACARVLSKARRLEAERVSRDATGML